jgi:hypothetical protein
MQVRRCLERILNLDERKDVAATERSLIEDSLLRESAAPNLRNFFDGVVTAAAIDAARQLAQDVRTLSEVRKASAAIDRDLEWK